MTKNAYSASGRGSCLYEMFPELVDPS